MNRHLTLPGLLLASLLVTACAPATTHSLVQPYVEPTTGKIAKLQLRSPRLPGTALLYSFDDARTCASPRLVSDSRRNGGQFQGSSSIVADGPRTLWFLYSPSAGRACGVMLTFLAVPDRNYAVFLSSAPNDSCGMIVADITDPANPKPERHYLQRRPSGNGTQTGNYCYSADVDAELAKPRKQNRSGLQMTDLKDILPPAPATPATAPTAPGAKS